VRIIARIAVGLVTSAIALAVAWLLLDDFDMDIVAFPVVVVIFTVVGAFTHPVIEAMIEKNVQLLASFVGLVVAFLTLLITDVISSDLSISGVTTWVLASLIVWCGGILADIIVGRWLFRRLVKDEPRAQAT
jgi:hypothetical protein